MGLDSGVTVNCSKETKEKERKIEVFSNKINKCTNKKRLKKKNM